jgi:hypothetical protein
VVRNGLRVHVGAAVSPDDRPAMVRLVRYVQRPIVDPASFEPRYPDAIRYRLAHPFSDGTTHVEFSAQALADKLGALVPPSSSPRTAYHGILAPKAAKRWRVVPAQLELASRVLAFAPNSPVRSAGPRKAPNKADGSVGECRHCGGPVVIVRLEETHAQEDGHAA